MGLNIGDLVSAKEIEIEYLQGRKIAIDAYNWTYQFLSIIRDRFTGEPLRDSKGQITSHLSGLLYRTARLLEAGIVPVYVWDGEPPAFKRKEIEKRAEIRKEAEVKWKEALKRGEVEKVRTYAQAAMRLTKDMVEESKRLLKYMGVSCAQAPSEGEAQCAFMCRQGLVWAAASQDYDSLAFGSPRLVRNLSITGKRKLPGREKYITVKPESVELEAVLKELGITQEQLVMIGLLGGTDYNPGGIKGIGPKKALELVKREKTLENVLKAVEGKWTHPVRPEEIFEFFLKPPVGKLEIMPESLEPEKLKDLMVSEHDFSEERMQSVIDKLVNKKEAGTQKGLGSFLK